MELQVLDSSRDLLRNTAMVPWCSQTPHSVFLCLWARGVVQPMGTSPPGVFILRTSAAAKPEGTIRSDRETSKEQSCVRGCCGQGPKHPGTGTAVLDPATWDLGTAAPAVPSRSVLVHGSVSTLRFSHQISSYALEKIIVVVQPSLCVVYGFFFHPDNIDLLGICKNLWCLIQMG